MVLSQIGIVDRERGGRAQVWNADWAWTVFVLGGIVDLEDQQVLMEIEDKNQYFLDIRIILKKNYICNLKELNKISLPGPQA